MEVFHRVVPTVAIPMIDGDWPAPALLMLRIRHATTDTTAAVTFKDSLTKPAGSVMRGSAVPVFAFETRPVLALPLGFSHAPCSALRTQSGHFSYFHVMPSNGIGG